MSLRSLAFGPLPRAQVQASQRIGQARPSAPRGPSLSALGGAQDDDVAAQAAVPREPESFNPVFPDLFAAEDTGEGGDVSALPGAQATAEPDFNSDTAQTLSNPPSPTGVVRQPGQLPEAWRTDLGTAFKALKALTPGVKAVEGAGGAVGGTLGGVTSLYGLATAAEAGNPVGIAQGALGTYQGLTGAAGVTPLASSLYNLSPEVASAVVNAVYGTSATTAGSVTPQLVGTALSGVGAAAAPIIQGIIYYLQNEEEMAARQSGWWNNPIKGALYANSTAGVGYANELLNSLARGGAGDLSGAPEQDLLQVLTTGSNALLPYYATAQGGRGPIRASDTLTGRGPGGQAYTEGISPEQYTANAEQAMAGLQGVIQELMRRGMTYEQLGQLPVSGDWAQETLDAINRPRDYLAANPRAPQFQQEALGLFGLQGLDPLASYSDAGGGWSQAYYKSQDQIVQELLDLALGASTKGPAAATGVSSRATDMYGGPLWTALARMGVGGDLGSLISQRFDPWVNVRQPAAGGA